MSAFMKWLRVLQYPVQGVLVLLLIHASADATEEMLRPLDDGRVGGIREYLIGVPLAYRRITHYCSGLGPFGYHNFDPVMLWLDIWFFLAVAHIGALRLPKLGARPKPREAPSVREAPGRWRLVALGAHGVVGLIYLVVGGLSGYGMVVGPVSWWHAAVVRNRFASLGRRPSWLSSVHWGLATAMGISGVTVYICAVYKLPWLAL